MNDHVRKWLVAGISFQYVSSMEMKETKKYSRQEFVSPVGVLTLVASETHLLGVLWKNDQSEKLSLARREQGSRHPVLSRTRTQLKEYFSGKRKEFDLPLEFQGTAFQKQVWKALSRIPYGKTFSYQEIAQQIGAPKACRAVGAANGKNPISIIVPCHRVIGANGTLTGFAGGIATKEKLLNLENTHG